MVTNDIYPWLSPILNKFFGYGNDEKLAHAWIFYGESGSGKTAFVKALSKQLLAAKAPNKQQWIEANTHPDFKMVSPNEQDKITIDLIREISDFLANTPAVGGKKIVCITQAEKMNLSAQSALLKILEEPAGHAYLFLTTENTNQLLPTIRSRCQKQGVPLPQITELDTWLSTQGIEMTAHHVQLAKVLANYSPGLTLFLLSAMKEPPALPFLLYFISVVAGNWQTIPGLKAFFEKQFELVLPNYVYAPETIKDRQLKIEFYRYVCHLRQKVRLFPGMNTKLLLHSIECFNQ